MTTPREVARLAEREFHPHQMLRELATGQLSSRTRDLVGAIGGKIRDNWHLEIPFGAMRDLAAISGSGGYLVATDNRAVEDALRPVSVVTAAGATLMTGLEGHVTLPRVAASATAQWLPNETTQITASQPTFGQITMSPKNAGIYIPISHQLVEQAPDLMRALQADMRKALGALIDAAAINGSGSSGQPQGLLNTTAVTKISGTSLDWADIVGMRKTVRDANGAELTTAWIAATDVAELLSKRERASGSGFILDNGKIDSRPCFVSTTVPSGTLLCADWSVVTLGFWGGIEFNMNPYQGFATGTIGARMLVATDVALRHPASSRCGR
jgi:HK97 family phage major capsid protein